MQHWVIATATGISLGLILFLCVRLRMYVGPILKNRYGAWARQTYWILTIVVMIALANLGLWLLRTYFRYFEIAGEALAFEIWFSILALIVAMGLIFNKLYRQR
jgi:hypothetical protein